MGRRERPALVVGVVLDLVFTGSRGICRLAGPRNVRRMAVGGEPGAEIESTGLSSPTRS